MLNPLLRHDCHGNQDMIYVENVQSWGMGIIIFVQVSNSNNKNE